MNDIKKVLTTEQFDESKNKEIEKILSEEQIKIFRKYVEDGQLRRPPRPGDPRSDSPPDGGPPNRPPMPPRR